MFLELLKNEFSEKIKIPVWFRIKLWVDSWLQAWLCSFWNEHKEAKTCLVYGESRFTHDDGKEKKIHHIVLRHFPLITRLKS